MVRYRLQTLIREDRDALATGAGSKGAFESSDEGGETRGKTVDSASGKRRVRNNVEAWRYVFDMCEDDGLRGEATEDDSDEIEAVRTRDWARPSDARYELRFDAIVGLTDRVRVWPGWFRCSRSRSTGLADEQGPESNYDGSEF